MLSLNVRTPVHENNHTSHRVQDPSLIRISQHKPPQTKGRRRYQIGIRRRMCGYRLDCLNRAQEVEC